MPISATAPRARHAHARSNHDRVRRLRELLRDLPRTRRAARRAGSLIRLEARQDARRYGREKRDELEQLELPFG